ncbi:MAG TPA: type VI secretion system accessory protein TagJ [bacterium]|nr:type VI secretion system accessory protein TagJ [bacterium]
MSAQELWKDGRLEDAVESQIAEVKANPSDPERRYLLFALVCFQGDLEKAARQLDAIGIQDERLQNGTLIYHNLLASEAERRRVHQGDGEPLVPAAELPALAARVAAVGALARGDAAEAATRLGEAGEQETAVAFRVDDREVNGVEDTDELLGPNLEIFAGSRYLLLPFDRIRTLEMQEPQHLLDLLWIPAELEDTDGTAASVHLPALYPDSHEGQVPLRLGRGTEWKEVHGVVRGRGQKVLALNGDGDPENDRALLSVRKIERIESGE